MSEKLEIRKIRHRNKMSQAQLAKLLGVSHTTVYRWESGDRKISAVNWMKLEKLSKRE